MVCLALSLNAARISPRHIAGICIGSLLDGLHRRKRASAQPPLDSRLDSSLSLHARHQIHHVRDDADSQSWCESWTHLGNPVSRVGDEKGGRLGASRGYAGGGVARGSGKRTRSIHSASVVVACGRRSVVLISSDSRNFGLDLDWSDRQPRRDHSRRCFASESLHPPRWSMGRCLPRSTRMSSRVLFRDYQQAMQGRDWLVQHESTQSWSRHL